MGMFDYVTLSAGVLDQVRAQYPGDKEIRFDGWQTKSLDCQLDKIKLDARRISCGDEVRPHFTGEIRFYQMAGEANTPSREWLEFVAVYVDGSLVAIRHIPDSK